MLNPRLIAAAAPTSRLDPSMQRGAIDLQRDIMHERSVGLVLISPNEALVASRTDLVIRLDCVNGLKGLCRVAAFGTVWPGAVATASSQRWFGRIPAPARCR